MLPCVVGVGSAVHGLVERVEMAVTAHCAGRWCCTTCPGTWVSLVLLAPLRTVSKVYEKTKLRHVLVHPRAYQWPPSTIENRRMAGRRAHHPSLSTHTHPGRHASGLLHTCKHTQHALVGSPVRAPPRYVSGICAYLWPQDTLTHSARAAPASAGKRWHAPAPTPPSSALKPAATVVLYQSPNQTGLHA